MLGVVNESNEIVSKIVKVSVEIFIDAHVTGFHNVTQYVNSIFFIQRNNLTLIISHRVGSDSFQNAISHLLKIRNFVNGTVNRPVYVREGHVDRSSWPSSTSDNLIHLGEVAQRQWFSQTCQGDDAIQAVTKTLGVVSVGKV